MPICYKGRSTDVHSIPLSFGQFDNHNRPDLSGPPKNKKLRLNRKLRLSANVRHLLVLEQKAYCCISIGIFLVIKLYLRYAISKDDIKGDIIFYR